MQWTHETLALSHVYFMQEQLEMLDVFTKARQMAEATIMQTVHETIARGIHIYHTKQSDDQVLNGEPVVENKLQTIR